MAFLKKLFPFVAFTFAMLIFWFTVAMLGCVYDTKNEMDTKTREEMLIEKKSNEFNYVSIPKDQFVVMEYNYPYYGQYLCIMELNECGIKYNIIKDSKGGLVVFSPQLDSIRSQFYKKFLNE